MLLLVGCRHPEQDYLYADELKAFAADGVAGCIPRSRAPTDRGPMSSTWSRRRRIGSWSLIDKGAVVYICGDGGKMEPDVKAALVSIYRERTGADADVGLRWIDDLGSKNRYVLDVWRGMICPSCRPPLQRGPSTPRRL
jgi:cytochrome P450/NADPH-cytochrome P450 reductase